MALGATLARRGNPGGLRSLTPAVADAIVQGVAGSLPVGTAATLAGVSPSAVSEWLRVADTGLWHDGTPAHPDSQAQCLRLSERIAEARAQSEAAHVLAIANAVDRQQQADWRARAWMLNNHPATRETWREHRQSTVINTGSVSVVHKLAQQLDRTTLTEAIPGEFRELMGPAEP